MLLYGAGGHAKVLISCIRACGLKVNVIFDDNPHIKKHCGIQVLPYQDRAVFTDEGIVLSVGENSMRRKIANQVFHRFAKIMHPSAIIDEQAEIGEGTVVMHRCVIQAGCSVGRHVIVNTGTIIEHDSTIADFVHLAPGVVICGNVTIGEDTMIGAGCIVVPNTHIGKNCLIAAGSIVTTQIPDNSIARGNPARVIKKQS